MSHLTQMAGLAVHNFVSAAAGAAVAVALDPRPRPPADAHDRQLLGRPHAHDVTRILLPLAFVVRARAREPGRRSRTSTAHARSRRSTGQTQTIPGGPIASQEAIKEIGENGGGPYNANSAHPFENPNPITNILEIWLLLAIPFALTVDVREDGRRPEAGLGGASPRCSCSGSRRRCVAMAFETHGQPEAHRRRREPDGRPRRSRAATWRARRSASARPAAACSRRRRPARRPARSTAQHDSYDAASAARSPLVNMMLGEVEPGRHRLGPLRHVDVRAARRCSSPA